MFSVGDRCILLFVANPKLAHYTGSECTIVSFDPVCKCKLCDCVVALPDGTERDAGTDQLRKIEDDYDGNTKITWDDMPYWKPRELIRV